MRSSPAGSRAAAAGLVLAVVSIASVVLSAHRADEYLQAARIAIALDRVEIEIDLTPGIELAAGLFDRIDRDRSGEVSSAEAAAYAAGVQADVSLELDDQRLPLELVEHRSADRPTVLGGQGTFRFTWAAALPALTNGPHRLDFRNDHQPAISVYLANVLVPETARVAVTDQWRDVNQREFRVGFIVRPPAAEGWLLPIGAVAAIVVVLVGWVLWARIR